jgi:lipopolysaccharide export LptBFGC system permease protein LptF
VLVRLFPLVLFAILLCGVLTHLVMPLGLADMRANKGRLLQTAIASKVAEGSEIVDHKGMTVWVSAADGAQLTDVRALMRRGEEFIAVYAPSARWVMADRGIHLECEDVQMLVRNRGQHLMTLDTDRYSYQFDNALAKRDRIDPDALSTPAVLALAAQVPKEGESHAVYNNARLTLHFRFFLPLSLIAFALLAMGLGLAFGTDQNLPGIIIIVVVVAAVVYPTFGYVKNRTSLPQVDPGFLLWPPGVLVGLIGGWMAWNPERARETLRAPLDWWATRRARRA